MLIHLEDDEVKKGRVIVMNVEQLKRNVEKVSDLKYSEKTIKKIKVVMNEVFKTIVLSYQEFENVKEDKNEWKELLSTLSDFDEAVEIYNAVSISKLARCELSAWTQYYNHLVNGKTKYTAHNRGAFSKTNKTVYNYGKKQNNGIIFDAYVKYVLFSKSWVRKYVDFDPLLYLKVDNIWFVSSVDLLIKLNDVKIGVEIKYNNIHFYDRLPFFYSTMFLNFNSIFSPKYFIASRSGDFVWKWEGADLMFKNEGYTTLVLKRPSLRAFNYVIKTLQETVKRGKEGQLRANPSFCYYCFWNIKKACPYFRMQKTLKKQVREGEITFSLDDVKKDEKILVSEKVKL